MDQLADLQVGLIRRVVTTTSVFRFFWPSAREAGGRLRRRAVEMGRMGGIDCGRGMASAIACGYQAYARPTMNQITVV
jgi:hypothetical protein